MIHIQKFKDFIHSISDDDKVAIIHDTDMDGFAAGVLAKKGLEQLQKNIVATIPKEHGTREITDTLLAQVADASVIVCVDLALENYEHSHLLSDKKVLVLDHHPTATPYEPSFVIIKPENIQSRVRNFQFCAAHLVYELFSELTNMTQYDWLALAGIVGDMTHPHHSELVSTIMNRHGWEIKKEMYDTTIGDVVKQVGYGCAVGSLESQNAIFSALDTATTTDDVLSSLHMFDSIKQEQQRLLDEFVTRKETYGSLHFYDITTEYSLASPVSSILSKKQVASHEILVITRSSDNGQTSASARRQDCQLDMGRMMRSCIQDFEHSNGGGHIPAAGAKFPTKYKQAFKKNIVQWVKDNE